MPRSFLPGRAAPCWTLCLAALFAALVAGPVSAQFQLPQGFEELMQRQGAGVPGAARGIDCTQLEAMARRGQQFPGGIDPQQLMQQMRCPAASPGQREKPALAENRTGASFCGMLRQALESTDSNYRAWVGPMPVHAATWMLSSR